MKTLLMICVLCVGATSARAAEPNCTAQEEGLKTAQANAKAKPDLSRCKDLKGKDKSKCERDLRDTPKKTVAAAQKAVACCKDPKSKECK